MLNKAMIIGRLGKDPVIKQSDNGNYFGRFTVCTSETYTKDGKKTETAEWHNIKVFGKTAELAEKFLHKGSLVYVEGKVRTESYEKNGTKVYTTNIICENLRFLSPKGEGTPKSDFPNVDPIEGNMDFDNIPF